jgi:hypothetical protein
MYKIWAKLIKDNRIKKDFVLDAGDLSENKLEVVSGLLEEICYTFDLSRPLWLKKHTKELLSHNIVHFYSEHFIDQINFDYLELEIYKEQ